LAYTITLPEELQNWASSEEDNSMLNRRKEKRMIWIFAQSTQKAASTTRE
jgi:hypothetical protein